MNSEKVKIFITPTLLSTLNVLSSEYHIEVGGYLVGEVKDGSIYLRELLIPNQVVSEAHVNISPQSQILLRQKYPKKFSQIIGHWHSHHHMGAFWSGQDVSNMKEGMLNKNFFVYIVSSKGQHLIKVCQKTPINYEFDDCDLIVRSKSINRVMLHVERIMEERHDNSYQYNNNDDNIETEEDVKEMEVEVVNHNTHMNHCYQDDYENSCKYGNEECPNKPKDTFLSLGDDYIPTKVQGDSDEQSRSYF